VRAVLQQWKKRGWRSYHAMGRTSRRQPHFRVCFNLLPVAATMPFAAKHSRHDVAKSRRRGLSPDGCFFKWRFARPLLTKVLQGREGSPCASNNPTPPSLLNTNAADQRRTQRAAFRQTSLWTSLQGRRGLRQPTPQLSAFSSLDEMCRPPNKAAVAVVRFVSVVLVRRAGDLLAWSRQPARDWGGRCIRAAFRFAEIIPLHALERSSSLRCFVLALRSSIVSAFR
jgi:hypothetical protein